MVDGGFIANFPIRLFDSTKYLDSTAVNRFFPNPQTLAFRIDRSSQIKNDVAGEGLASMDIFSIKDYFSAFYNLVIENLNRQNLTKEDWRRTVSIPDGNVSPRVRRLSSSEMTTLINNGFVATRQYLEQ